MKLKLRLSPTIIWHRLQLLGLYFRNSSVRHIHIIGDSHSSFCFTNIKPVARAIEKSLFRYKDKHGVSKKFPFFIHWLGPVTMFRIARDGLQAIHLKSLKVAEKDVVVFVFGEIDVRCHIEKQSLLQNVHWCDIVDKLVENYMRTIIDNRKLFDDLKCIVCSIVPPTDKQFNIKYPFFGSLQTRIEVAKKLNLKLQEACFIHGFSFLDLYTEHATDNGDLKHEISDGGVHISQKHNTSVKIKLMELIANYSGS